MREDRRPQLGSIRLAMELQIGRFVDPRARRLRRGDEPVDEGIGQLGLVERDFRAWLDGQLRRRWPPAGGTPPSRSNSRTTSEPMPEAGRNTRRRPACGADAIEAPDAPPNAAGFHADRRARADEPKLRARRPLRSRRGGWPVVGPNQPSGAPRPGALRGTRRWRAASRQPAQHLERPCGDEHRVSSLAAAAVASAASQARRGSVRSTSACHAARSRPTEHGLSAAPEASACRTRSTARRAATDGSVPSPAPDVPETRGRH